MTRPRLILHPTRENTRLLMSYGRIELLKARLPSPGLTHPDAASALCEALSMWLAAPLSVVVLADASADSSALGLCDGFGFGVSRDSYAVEVVEPARPRRSLGSFRELRQLLARCAR
jgi:hypothetical protein